MVLFVVIAAAAAAPADPAAEDRSISGLMTRMNQQLDAREVPGKVSVLANAMKKVFEVGPDGHWGTAAPADGLGKWGK